MFATGYVFKGALHPKIINTFQIALIFIHLDCYDEVCLVSEIIAVEMSVFSRISWD